MCVSVCVGWVCIDELRENIQKQEKRAKRQGVRSAAEVKREKREKQMRGRQREMEKKKGYDRTGEEDREREGGRGMEGGREVVGVGGYQGQEQLRSPTPAVPSEGRQRGSRWAISGRMLAAAATAGPAAPRLPEDASARKRRRRKRKAAQVALIRREDDGASEAKGRDRDAVGFSESSPEKCVRKVSREEQIILISPNIMA